MWSSAFAGVRVASASYSFGAMALLRFGAAAVCALIYLVATRAPLPTGKDLVRIALAGIIGFSIYHPLFNFVEQDVQAGAAAAIIAAIPVFTALLSYVFLKERLPASAWAGILLSVVGVVIISFGGGGIAQFNPKALLLLICALCTATYTLLTKSLLGRYSGIQLASVALIVGTIPLFVFAPALVRELPAAAPSSTIAVLYMGIFPAFLAYALWNVVLSKVPATKLSVFLNFQPLIAAIIAWVWMREVPHLLVYLGGAVALIGVLLVQRKPALAPEHH
jgi:drug/metabolite transporter (DMT)-like permease